MSDIAIRVDGLGKRYRIGGKQERYQRFTEQVMDSITAPIRRLRNMGKAAPPEEILWALKDVSFEVQRGEAVGIIGRNGAGKSTLLKILSRITEPTVGRVELHGRVSSLLEVGTGFHPELTGRENVYLNGTILGMRKAEIERKFDEIVDFSGVEKFIDTPVKRYSSGMQVRLAFAVAAHLEPEILLVDEVLAVGDAEFQKKCLGKMGEVAHEGRTVLFVSHNMAAVETLCQRAVQLDTGSLARDGAVVEVVDAYLSSSASESGAIWQSCENEFSNPWFTPTRLTVCSEDGQPATGPLRNSEAIHLSVQGVVQDVSDSLILGYALYDERGTVVYLSTNCDGLEATWPRICRGPNTLRTHIPSRLLNEGEYSAKLFVQIRSSLTSKIIIADHQSECPQIRFQILGGLSDSPIWTARRPGVIAPLLSWELVDSWPERT